jgi:hypothetical protein
MSKGKEVLGGFDAVFGGLRSNDNSRAIPGMEVYGGTDIDEENPFDLIDENDTTEEFQNDEPIKDEESKVEEKPSEDEPKEEEQNDDANEDSTVVSTFFDALAETIGWEDISDDEKPKSVEDLVEYMKSAIEVNSAPSYANDQIKELDDFVKNGGSIQDYFNLSSSYEYDDVDTSNIATQKEIVKEFLAQKGFNDTQIRRKIEKYEDADILEDEAIDALEFLKESKEVEKKELLENQKMAKEKAEQEQQKFYNSVVQEIESTSEVRGIKIPKQDKKELMEYIFRVESDGLTKYQKDYAKSTKNLIESAYFTMKGDALISQAKKSGETSAVEKFKDSLKSTKFVGGSKQTINNGGVRNIWDIASSQLMKPSKN